MTPLERMKEMAAKENAEMRRRSGLMQTPTTTGEIKARRAVVDNLAGQGYPTVEIASYLSVSRQIIRKDLVALGRTKP